LRSGCRPGWDGVRSHQVAAAVGSKRLGALADAAEEGKPSEAEEAAGALVESGRRLREAETAFRGAVEG
jgi:hypothetical protein